MKKEPHIYTVKELLQNESFLRWKLLSEEEDKKRWENYLKKNPEEKGNMDEAAGIVKLLRFNNYTFTPEENVLMMQAIEGKIKKSAHTRKRKLYILWTSVAAAVAILLLLLIPNDLEDINKSFTELANIERDESNKDIRIQVDGESITLTKDANIEYNESGDFIVTTEEGEVVKKKVETETVALNKLIVPMGKRSSLTLADGSKIWVNSGTVVEFPSVFKEETRQIQVNGEIYIEVAKNESQPFIVNTRQLAVRVLGTSFNVSAYEEDLVSAVVLVEGKVEVSAKNEKIDLSPNQMLSVNQTGIKTSKVDAYDYICWKDGLMRFTREPLPSILTRISRYYNKNIYWEEAVETMNGTGKLVLFDNLNDVLETLHNALPVQYEEKEDGIYISPK